MTNEEAIEQLEKHSICDTTGFSDENDLEASRLAVEALKKQIPMKPVLKNGKGISHINHGDKPHELKITAWQYWFCPICNRPIGERYNVEMKDGGIHSHDQKKCNFCNECGQAIDWREE